VPKHLKYSKEQASSTSLTFLTRIDATAAFCHTVDPLEQNSARKLDVTFHLL